MQNPLSIPEIYEAIELLQSYELSSASYPDTENFKCAIDILNDYLEDFPDTPHREFIKNKKLAHTRQMLSNLASVYKSGPAATQVAHIGLVVHTWKDGAGNFMEINPGWKNDFNKLMFKWSNELAEVWTKPIAHMLVDHEYEL